MYILARSLDILVDVTFLKTAKMRPKVVPLTYDFISLPGCYIRDMS